MDSTKFSSWIQIAATLGVVLGLGLVIIELRQTKALTRVQLGSQHFSETFANERTLMGENPSEALYKACVGPEKLTEQDMLVLQSYFRLYEHQALRLWSLESIGGFDSAWNTGASDAYGVIASTSPGKAWLADRRIRFEELREVRDAVLESHTGSECATELNMLSG